MSRFRNILHKNNRYKLGLAIGIILIFVISAAAGIYLVTIRSSSSQSTTTSKTENLTLTWETVNSPQYLDPDVAYLGYDENVQMNTYENLLWYNGSCSSCIIPWLAQSYTVSPDLKTYNFTLRAGIKFADGEPLNSTAVYFSLNRILFDDSSSPVSLGTQAAWDMQNLENHSLSYVWGGPHQYTQGWARAVLAQDFVQITGPLTFTLHVENPSAAFGYLIAGPWAEIMAPDYVMQNDLALWTQPDNGYSFPFPTLQGNATTIMNEYFFDWTATCTRGVTPNGCATTYLDESTNGSLAGTGPYVIKSVDWSTGDTVLTANPSYWGGPYQFSGGTKIIPHYQTVNFVHVPQLSTREIDLQSAAKSDESMIVDVPSGNLYDIASRSAWLTNDTLVSVVPGVSMYGPFTEFGIEFGAFPLNVTNPLTGEYYQFQPFADERIRLAFSDTVNVTEINQDFNNNMGEVADNVEAPGISPAGSFNESIRSIYSYNLTATQDLLIEAMEHPITEFTFFNGTSAPAGLFNNTFGCPTLNSYNQCNNPVSQTIQLSYAVGDSVGEAVDTTIASAINNISATFNMGLTVTVAPLFLSQLSTEASSGGLSMYTTATGPDYGWAMNVISYMYPPTGGESEPSGWNLTAMANLNAQGNYATASGNSTGVAKVSNAMDMIANQEVMYLWIDWPQEFIVMTSSVTGYYYNQSIYGNFYFASLQPT